MDLATIWSVVDKLTKKPTLIKPIDINTCHECKTIKIISKEGIPTCPNCGLTDTTYIDENPEWTSGVTEDGKVNDPSRCGNPNANPELFQNSIDDYIDINYIISPGDEIVVMLWGDTEINQRYTVAKDGYLFIENLGQIFVNGLTLEKLEKKL